MRPAWKTLLITENWCSTGAITFARNLFSVMSFSSSGCPRKFINVSLSLQSCSTCSSEMPYHDWSTSTFVIRTTSMCGLPSPVLAKSGSSIGLNAYQLTRFATLPSLSSFLKRLLYSALNSFRMPMVDKWRKARFGSVLSCYLDYLIAFLEVTYSVYCIFMVMQEW